MNQDSNLLTELSAALPDLNKSEAKVANAILEDPEAATRSSIAVLAAAAQVSEPSVNRFCKRFGSKGFPDFFPSKTFKFSPSKPKTITEVAIATLNCCGEKSTRIIKIFEKRVNN